MSDKPKILMLRRLPDAVEARAAASYDITPNVDNVPYSADEIVAKAEGYDGLICTPTDKINAELIARLPDSIRIIATFSVGFDHVDLSAAKERGIAVTNTPEVLTDATADIAVLLLLGASRRAIEGTDILRAGKWDGWCPTQLRGVGVQGKRVGVLGMGRIGQAFARRMLPFGVELHYYDVVRLPEDVACGATYHETVEDLLKVSDFLSIHCNMTPEMYHFLNTERLEMMPENAVVVNTARGPIVHDDSMIAALKSGRIAAAGLDVFEGEPNVNPGYFDLPNAFVLPHLGSATMETRDAMGFRALDNIDAFFTDGQEPGDRLV